ncbi:hypothetical protein J1614_009937 [Plenodomus biglobosus]|nr:hypothetical protein J1614_009937 [Plenodomus biglobosus]
MLARRPRDPVIRYVILLIDFIQQTAHTDLLQWIFTVASLAVDVSRVPESAFTPHGDSCSKAYFTLEYEVEISEASLEFCLLVNGVRYGSVTAQYA